MFLLLIVAIGVVAVVLLLQLKNRDLSSSGSVGYREVSAPADLNGLLRAGRKIEAIKLYREQNSVGLREAKEAVEDMERRMHSEPTAPPD